MLDKTVDPLLGQTLAGEFHVIRALGQGGMGTVYLAEQVALGRPVAVKLLAPAATAVPEALARFQREARAAGRLQHPNVVQVYSFGCDAGRHFIAMEYVDGVSLARRLVKEKRISVTEALRIGREVALALAAAHKLGLIHRDVKPDNIFLTAEGSVKLGDFGLARDLSDAGLSQPGIVLGTPHYMSPEQSQAKSVDGRTDLYSLGATLFHALTGRPPYEGAAATEVLIKHITAPVPSASSVCTGIPAPVDALLRRLMEKDPGRRPPSAGEVVTALDALRARVRTPAALATSATPTTPARSATPARPATSATSATFATSATPEVRSVPAAAPARAPAPPPTPPSVPAPSSTRPFGLWRVLAIAALGALAGLGATRVFTSRTPGPTAERRQPPSSVPTHDLPEVATEPHPPTAPASLPAGPQPGAAADPAATPAAAPPPAAASEEDADGNKVSGPAPAAAAAETAARRKAEEEQRAADARAQEEARRVERAHKAAAAWSAFAPAAWEPAAAGDWDAALALCAAAEADADSDLQPLADRLAAFHRVLESGRRASAAVLEGAKLQIDHDVVLRRCDGKELKGRVTRVSPAGQVVLRLAEMKGAESGVPIADLAADERIRFAASGLGNDATAEVASAIFALGLGDPCPLRTFLAHDETEQGQPGADLRMAAEGWAAPWTEDRLEQPTAAAAGNGTGAAHAATAGSDPAERRFRMGFRPVDYATFDEDSPTLEETYRFLAQHGDIVAHQLDDGVPWPEAFDGRPYHANVEKHLACRQRHKGLGQVFVATTPARDGRIAYWAGEDESERPGVWADKRLDDPDMVAAYTRYCRDLIRRFQPAYLAYAIQANCLAEDPKQWQEFLTLSRQVYGTLKKENPALPLFVTLSANEYWKDPERQKEIIRSLLPYSDYVAVSCFPCVDEPDPGRLPRDLFSALRDLAPDKPYAVAETGFIAKPLSADVSGSTAWQEAYVKFLLEESQRLKARFVIWFVPRDFDIFYQSMEALAAKSPEVKEAVRVFRLFRDSGLLDGQGQPRPSFKVWESWRQLHLAPR